MSAILVTATAAAVEVNQATTQATGAPRPAMTMMQTALASQQAVAADIRADLGAGPTGSKGSDTGEVSCVSGLSISLPPAVGCEISTGAGSRCRHGRTPSVIVAYPCLTSPASRRELPALAAPAAR
jgi:hypothetical protein